MCARERGILDFIPSIGVEGSSSFAVLSNLSGIVLLHPQISQTPQLAHPVHLTYGVPR